MDEFAEETLPWIDRPDTDIDGYVDGLPSADLGYDLIWFGIIVVVVTEISLITPPVGLNVFVLRGMLPDVSTATIFRGVTPFWCADIVRLAILVALPSVSLVLPHLFFK